MTNNFLDLIGLSTFLNELKSLFATKNELGNIQADWNNTDINSSSFIKNKPTSMPASDVSPWAKASKKPSYTASEIEADPKGSASNALSSAKIYTDEKISGLINGAPETLNTLKEVADAIEENETIVEALNSAIGTKANTIDLTSHTNNLTAHVTSSERTKWNSAKNHADSMHAPSNAEKNTIVSIKKNGTIITPDSSRSVDIEIPDDYITSGSQTTTSSVDGGYNIYTFTKSDGTESTFTVKNGTKGATGSTGATGIRGSMIYWGTSITGTSTAATIFSSSGVSSALVNDLYINTNTWNVYQCSTAGNGSTAKWVYKGNIKGSTGAQGSAGVSAGFGTPTATIDENIGTPSVTVTTSGSNTAKIFNFVFKNLKGEKGDKGATGASGTRGSRWYTGTTITGTSITDTVFSSSGISNALENDMYLNTSTSNVYKCTNAGTANVAKWVYVGNIKGAPGTNATTTEIASSTKNGLMSYRDFTKLRKVTETEMGYLSGTTSSVQKQINEIANEVLSASEPINQKNGDYWIIEY